MAGEQRLHAVEEVESKEWRQEDVGRRHPRGLRGAKAVEVEPRRGGMITQSINPP